MPALSEGLDPTLSTNLAARGVPIVGREFAQEHDIPKTSFVLANMMPAAVMESTEVQWAEQYCSEPDVGVEVELAKFDDDCREGINDLTGEPRSRTNILSRYTELSDIKTPVGILVLTGDNLEVEPSPEGLSSRKPEPIELDDITYGSRLTDLVNWGERNAAITVVSCLASHFVLNYFHNTPKKTMDKKIFGVYDHEIMDPQDPFVRSLGRKIISPHSRWGDVSLDQIEERNRGLKEARRLKVLATSEQVGWLVLKETLPNGHVRLYLQGHPEYDRDDLAAEWKRDRDSGLALPANYFKDDDPTNNPIVSWAYSARTLNHNTIIESCRIAKEPPLAT